MTGEAPAMTSELWVERGRGKAQNSHIIADAGPCEEPPWVPLQYFCLHLIGHRNHIVTPENAGSVVSGPSTTAPEEGYVAVQVQGCARWQVCT